MASLLEQGQGSPVIFLHGLFGTARNWGHVATEVSSGAHVVALDLRNHGSSPWQETMSLSIMADDVFRFLAEHFPQGAAVVGHSLGGKVAMVLALRQPEIVSRLLIVDVAPVRYPPEYRHYVQAMRALDLSSFHRRADVDAALAAVVPDRRIRLFLLQNLGSGENGYFWRANLRVIEEAMDDLSAFPEFAPGTQYRGPTLFLRGGRSSYVKDSDRPLIESLFPAVRLETLPDAGHWLHADHPQAFVAAVSSFLQQD